MRAIPKLINLGLVLLFGFSGIMKLLSPSQLVDQFEKWGLAGWQGLIGTAEILFLVTFLIPRTMVAGLLMLTAYLGGAVAVHMSHGEPPVLPIIVMGLLWFVAYHRHPQIFERLFPGTL